MASAVRDIRYFIARKGSCRWPRLLPSPAYHITHDALQGGYGGPVSEDMAELLTQLVRASRSASFDSSARVRVAAIRTSRSGQAPCLPEA